jgi:ribonuclease P protein component
VEHEGGFDRTTPRERFGRASRLRSPVDFQRVRRTGKRRQGRYLTLHFARAVSVPEANGAQVAPARVGFSVSKRVGSAVQRNLVKRRLREAIRRRLWNVAPGWDMIVTARPDAAMADYTALCNDIDTLLAQARLLRAPDRRNAATNGSTNQTASVTTSETKSET